MFKKILVAYDGSETSQAALDYAAELADSNQALLFLTHVMREKETPFSPVKHTPLSHNRESETPLTLPNGEDTSHSGHIKKDKGTFLLERARNNLYLDTSQVELQVLYGDPAKKICEYADKEDMDIIIMGNRGIHGFRKFMLGSISQKVIQNAHCPVLVVK